MGSFSPLHYLLFPCICTSIIIFLVGTRAFISGNELQYLHCSLNIWRIVSCPMLIRHIGKHFMLGLSPAFHSVTSREAEHAQRGLGTRLIQMIITPPARRAWRSIKFALFLFYFFPCRKFGYISWVVPLAFLCCLAHCYTSFYTLHYKHIL